MSLDLGDLAGLATAIGLIDEDGDAVDSWFADPGRHLSRVLANPVQRGALVALVDDLLGGSEAATDASGRTWLPIVEVEGETLRLFVTLQETGGGAQLRVGVGLRLRVAADGVAAEVDAHVPLFLAAGTAPVDDPLLLGKAGAPVEAALRLTLPPDTTPGRVALAAAELAARVPTSGGEEPSCAACACPVLPPRATWSSMRPPWTSWTTRCWS
jgi:large repetitive protein